MRIKDDIKNIAPTPAAYQAIRQDARNKGAASLSLREIAAVRKQKTKRLKLQPKHVIDRDRGRDHEVSKDWFTLNNPEELVKECEAVDELSRKIPKGRQRN